MIVCGKWGIAGVQSLLFLSAFILNLSGCMRCKKVSGVSRDVQLHTCSWFVREPLLCCLDTVLLEDEPSAQCEVLNLLSDLSVFCSKRVDSAGCAITLEPETTNNRAMMGQLSEYWDDFHQGIATAQALKEKWASQNDFGNVRAKTVKHHFDELWEDECISSAEL